ncbi:dead end protein homolog 1-like [Nilaparvata lugens]|uniref:dead end protein homolog 1-like n=1 Tax=Nilaparvata lugens TaxID=108931 RepID=UPI00193E0C02|nr:dead end protein homolog 1-like [Nilaparvata lugens]
MGELHYFNVEDIFGEYSFTRMNGQRIIRRVNLLQDIGADNRGLEIIVKNIPSECNEKFLFELFHSAGVIVEIRVMVKHDEQCKGIAFVKYLTPKMCEVAVALLNGYKIGGGRSLIVEKSLEFNELEFAGIPPSVSLRCLETFFFSKFKDVSEIKVLNKNEEQQKVGVAFKCHRAAALARRQFCSQKQVYWKSLITVEWPESTKKTMKRDDRGSSDRNEEPHLNLNVWENIEFSMKTN